MFYRSIPVEYQQEVADKTAEFESWKKEMQGKINAYHELQNIKRKELEANRQWNYEVKTLDGTWFGWSLLYKSAITPVEGNDDNEQWSSPFKIINNVLFHAENSYNSKCYMSANKQIPQGLVSPDFDPATIKW